MTAADPGPFDTAVLDVDGTLVDTNYQHALCWFMAFRSVDVTPPLWRIHRAIGMGGDKLVAAVAGDDVEQRHGDEVRKRWEAEFDQWIDSVPAFEQARELLVDLRERGLSVVLASSGKAKHVDHYLDLLDAREIADAWTTADDADESKPAPDLVQAAMSRVDARRAVLVGDSVWDAHSGSHAGVPTVALRTGGFSTDELTEAGARAVYESIAELRADLDAVLRP